MTARATWLFGAVAGATAGLGTALAGTLPALVAILSLMWAVTRPQRLAALSGVLIGFGGVWLALLSNVAVRCQAGCAAPGIGGWIAIAAVMSALGLAAGALAVKPSPRA